MHEPNVPRLAGLIPNDDPIIRKIGGKAKVFLVGGAVRDGLLGRPVVDKDFVVVGSDVAAMENAGFIPVGKDFPVFLHPKTHEEYALARTERKSGRGYKGFVFSADPTVTLDEDLSRRDLTINAMAVDFQGDLIDPFNGAEDLKNRTFRHVGPAFSEDPVRLLRLARFSARFPDFKIAPETLALCKDLVASGETGALVAERVWQELSKGLSEKMPSCMINTLLNCNAWVSVTGAEMPDAATLAALDRASEALASSDVRAAMLLSALRLPKSVEPIRHTLRPPRGAQELAQTLVAAELQLQKVVSALDEKSDLALAAQQILDWLETTDALRRPERFAEVLLALKCQLQLTKENAQKLSQIVGQMLTADLQASVAKAASAAQQSGVSIAHAVRQERLRALQALLSKTI